MAMNVVLCTLSSLLLLTVVVSGEKCRVTKNLYQLLASETTLSCNFNALGEDIQASITLKLCRDDPKVSATLDIDALGIHKKKEGDASIAIPISSLGSLEVSIESNNPEDESVKISVRPLNAMSIPIFSKQLDEDGQCNDIMYWINSQGIGAIVGIGIGALLLLIGCCCCCCYCCCCRKKKQPAVVIVQSGHQMAPAQSNLPYVRATDLDDMA